MGLTPSSVPRRRLSVEDFHQLRHAAQRVLTVQADVVAAYLYGSASRGEPARDLDIAVLFRDETPAFGELERLASEIQRIGAPHGPEIDLRPLRQAAPRFRVNVIEEGQLLVDHDIRRRLEFEASSMSQWLDFKPIWERMQRKMAERLQDG